MFFEIKMPKRYVAALVCAWNLFFLGVGYIMHYYPSCKTLDMCIQRIKCGLLLNTCFVYLYTNMLNFTGL